jgi:hypothetical protein
MGGKGEVSNIVLAESKELSNSHNGWGRKCSTEMA